MQEQVQPPSSIGIHWAPFLQRLRAQASTNAEKCTQIFWVMVEGDIPMQLKVLKTKHCYFCSLLFDHVQIRWTLWSTVTHVVLIVISKWSGNHIKCCFIYLFGDNILTAFTELSFIARWTDAIVKSTITWVSNTLGTIGTLVVVTWVGSLLAVFAIETVCAFTSVIFTWSWYLCAGSTVGTLVVVAGILFCGKNWNIFYLQMFTIV